ncbi:MAG: class I SAM-dependent methyltransferase [Promethearchaeota archaeon]
MNNKDIIDRDVREILRKLIDSFLSFYFNKIIDVKGFYEKSARFYEMAHHLQTLYADNIHRIVVSDAANFKSGDITLDVGTGTSLSAICAVNRVYPEKKIRIIGLDLSFRMLQKAKKNQDRYKTGKLIFLLNGDARFLPIRKNIFNKVISVYGLGGIKVGLNRVVKELIRVAKNSALFSIGEMTSPPREKGIFKRVLHELIIEPMINLIWHFEDFNPMDLFYNNNIQIIKRKYYDTYYFGSMTLLVAKLIKNRKDK